MSEPIVQAVIFAIDGLLLDTELVLEHSEPGVWAAHRAGMRVLIVPDLKRPSAEVAALAEGVFDSLAEAQEFLIGALGPR